MKVNAGGIAVNYEIDGPANGPVVVLSHSLATDLSMWDPQVKALASRYRVVRYDTRGHGSTEVPPGPYTLEQLAADALAMLDALGVRRLHWVGLSMGGMIGQLLALAAPDRLASLALCDTTSRIPPEAQPVWDERIRTARERGMEALVEPTLARWFTEPFLARRDAVVERVAAMIRGTNPAGYVGCCEAIRRLDLTARLGEVRTPTLVIVGAQDQGTPLSASQAIHQAIRGSELAVLDPASHLSNLEQADAFDRALLTFLARVA